MKRSRLLALAAVTALAFALVVPAPAYAKKSIGISSSEFDFSLSAGQSGKGQIEVSNEGDEPLKVLVYAADQSVSSTGTTVYKMPTRDSAGFGQSAAAWVKIGMPAESKSYGNLPYLELKPGQHIPIGFEFIVPDGTTPGDHQILVFFEMFEIKGAADGNTASISGRIGSRVKVRVAGTLVDSLDISPFIVKGFVIGEGIPYTFTLRNKGNVDKDLAASMTLLDANDAESERSAVMSRTVVYAGNDRETSGVYTPAKAGFGRYTVRLTVDNLDKDGKPGPQPFVKERSVFLVPLWMVVALAALIVAILVGLVWLVVRRGAKRRAARDAAPAPVAAIPVTPTTVAADDVAGEEKRVAE